MKKIIDYVQLVIVTVCLLVAPGCAIGADGYDPSAALAKAWADARDPGGPGGVEITDAEAALIKPHADAYFDALGQKAKETDWGGLAAGAAVAVGGAVSTKLLGFDLFKFIYPVGKTKPPLGKFSNVSVDGVPVEALNDADPKNPQAPKA